MIHWSSEQERLGLPEVSRGIDPAWLSGTSSKLDEGWSLSYEFNSPPLTQGNPSIARVQFLVDEAPHKQLAAGVSLWLFERATQQYANVEILD